MTENDKEFVEYVVKAIVDKPEKVQVERKVDEMGVLIELTVDPEDMGKIIGKEGRTAKAIRTLLRVLGAQSNARINLKIIEPEGSEGRRPAEESVGESAPQTTEVEAPQASEEDVPQTTTKDDLKELSEE